MPQDSYQALLLPEAMNLYARLIISINTIEEFKDFVTNKNHTPQLFKVYNQLKNKPEKRVEAYNQLLAEKMVLNNKNGKLKQEVEEQKKKMLRIKDALTCIKEQVVEL